MEILMVIVVILFFLFLISGSSSKPIKKKPTFVNLTSLKELEVVDTDDYIGNIKDWLNKYSNDLKITHILEKELERVSIYGNKENEYKLGHIEDNVAKQLLNSDENFIVELKNKPEIKEKKDDKGKTILKYATIKYDILKEK